MIAVHGGSSPKQSSVDWQAWVDSWDAQQAGYVADRDERLSLALDVLEHIDAAPGTLLDLGCGPGTIARSALHRFPGARVVAVDTDPFLLELGRQTLGDRVEWVEADLSEPQWGANLADASTDAACSATALHWLHRDHLDQMFKILATKLRPGGVFINYDTLPLSSDRTPRLAALASHLRHARSRDEHERGVTDWESWWKAAHAEPEFVELLAERERVFASRSSTSAVGFADMADSLRANGFTEVDTLAQDAERRLLVAIR